MEIAWLFPLGLGVGAFGTLVGAGGGFVLVPVLLFLYPDMKASTVTSISLLVVTANAASGSIAYGLQRRIRRAQRDLVRLLNVARRDCRLPRG